MRLAWKEHIKRATAKGKFSKRAKELADSWPHCAVGEKLASEDIVGDAAIQDYIFGGSTGYGDDQLFSLGIDFTHAVKDNKLKSAKRIYRAIRKYELYP